MAPNPKIKLNKSVDRVIGCVCHGSIVGALKTKPQKLTFTPVHRIGKKGAINGAVSGSQFRVEGVSRVGARE